jgi:hypothetical protein
MHDSSTIIKKITSESKIIDIEEYVFGIIDLIQEAANKVPKSYLKVPTRSNPAGIVRERVFCYELYHQMRLGQGSEPFFVINGEIDNRGILEFRKENRKNPDFIFYANHNIGLDTIAMEVKGKISSKGKIIEDFEKLLNWIYHEEYEFGVFLLYNYSLTEFVNIVGDLIAAYYRENDAWKISIITLPEANKVEQAVTLAQLLDDSRYFTLVRDVPVAPPEIATLQ